MHQQPGQSPWGKVQICDILCPSVLLVSTASHGGAMVAKDMTVMLSPVTTKYSFRHSGFLCSEGDIQEDVALREPLDKELRAIPDRIRDKVALRESTNKSLREHNPDYQQVRQAGPEKTPARQMVPIHSAER